MSFVFQSKVHPDDNCAGQPEEIKLPSQILIHGYKSGIGHYTNIGGNAFHPSGQVSHSSSHRIRSSLIVWGEANPHLLQEKRLLQQRSQKYDRVDCTLIVQLSTVDANMAPGASRIHVRVCYRLESVMKTLFGAALLVSCLTLVTGKEVL
jgi:hypothetical protein